MKDPCSGSFHPDWKIASVKSRLTINVTLRFDGLGVNTEVNQQCVLSGAKAASKLLETDTTECLSKI